MSYPCNHKTVFVLDRSPAFARPCAQIEFDFHRSRAGGGGLGGAPPAPGYIPSAPVTKTMWTTTAESVLEYCRIVWDLAPQDKLVRFVVAGDGVDPAAINAWEEGEQNSASVAAGLARFGKNPKAGSSAGEHGVLGGLILALESLCQATPTQKRVLEAERTRGDGDLSSSSTPSLLNRGRIICLTHASEGERDIERLVQGFKQHLSSVNRAASAAPASENLLAISQVSLEIVHCYPGNLVCSVATSPSAIELSPILSYQVHATEAGTELPRKMLHLALCHYHLASTTVTGIPMKEEQNASSSANYDVELFHAASAHTKLLSEGCDLVQSIKDGNEYKTITLKWCTPRGSSTADMHFCTDAVRITPTDVNSRPSSCLTNFLLSGRSVMLEMPRRTGAKVVSHMLTAHGGEIFLHTLNISNASKPSSSSLAAAAGAGGGGFLTDDPPSVSEGPGGRVTDYRIPDLGELMRANRLSPWFTEDGRGLRRAEGRLGRHALVWPMTISSTTIFNMAALEKLQRIMVQEELGDEDVAECRKAIYTLLSMENKGEVLPVPVQMTPAGKTKSMKKDEQYRVMFAELEKFLASHSRTDKHSKVLECFLEVRNKTLTEKPVKFSPRPSSAGKEGIDVETALREMDRYNAMTEREKSDFNMSGDGVLRSTTETPMSPTSPGAGGPPLAAAASSRKKSAFGSSNGGKGTSLLDMWTKKIEKENAKKHVPFHGLRNLGEKAKLYLNLEKLKEAEMATDN